MSVRVVRRFGFEFHVLRGEVCRWDLGDGGLPCVCRCEMLRVFVVGMCGRAGLGGWIGLLWFVYIAASFVGLFLLSSKNYRFICFDSPFLITWLKAVSILLKMGSAGTQTWLDKLSEQCKQDGYT